MADVMAVARKQYVQRQLLARRAVLAVRKTWSNLDPNAIRATWHAAVGPAVFTITTGAQLKAASAADSNVSATLAAQGITATTDGTVVAGALAGIASDGRDLASLLELSNYVALHAIRQGTSVENALTMGRKWLEQIVGTQVVDAGRVADGVAIAARPKVREYVRMLNPPSCARCIALAGKTYRWNAGFERHPRCDCRHIPVDEATADDIRLDPKAYFDSLSKAEQDRVFTNAGAQAIRDGADISQVVNARRGMNVAGHTETTKRIINGEEFTVNVHHRTLATREVFGRQAFTTTEGMTRHGAAGQRLGESSNGVRLMPEQIYRDANGNREEAIRLLHRFGYIR